MSGGQGPWTWGSRYSLQGCGVQGEPQRAAQHPFRRARCPNFLPTLFAVYSNSVILNKNSVSCARMIDYCAVARSPPRDRLGAGGAA